MGRDASDEASEEDSSTISAHLAGCVALMGGVLPLPCQQMLLFNADSCHPPEGQPQNAVPMMLTTVDKCMPQVDDIFAA